MTDVRDIRIDAAAASDIDTVRTLFVEYQAWLDIDLCFQGFDEELASLPGDYVAPRGGLWLARVGDEVAGVVALRPWDDRTAELKRLWVRQAHRGLGLGRRLTDEALSAARAARYASVRLDTLPAMGQARALYASLGFRTIDAYYDNPVAGVLYMELELTRSV